MNTYINKFNWNDINKYNKQIQNVIAYLINYKNKLIDTLIIYK